MKPRMNRSCTAFADHLKIASGSVAEVALEVKRFLNHEKRPTATLLIFDDLTSDQIEMDLRGTDEEILDRFSMEKPEHLESSESLGKEKGPGRPKLGIVAREVTLLPRHWEWLGLQSGGASATLRKLVEEAKKKNPARDQFRQVQEATHKFMSAMAGNLPQFEEALRSLYAKENEKFGKIIAPWPKDIQEHIHKLMGSKSDAAPRV